MNRDSNKHTYIFAILMVVSVAFVLSFTSESLKDLQNSNVKKEKMQNILSSVGINVSRDESEDLYMDYISEELSLKSDGTIDSDIEAFEINLALEVKKDSDTQRFPLYIANVDNEKFYVTPVNKIDAWGKRIEIKNDINSNDYKLILVSSGPDKTLNTPDDLTNEISPNSYSGVMLTEKAYRMISSSLGPYLLLICVLCFSFSSMIGFSYYVTKCGMFLFGIKARIPLIIFYLIGIIISAIVDLKYLIYFLDIMFGLMAVPTIISTIILSPRVMKEARKYFITLKGV